MAHIAWIGAGVMGRPMAGHLAAHGHSVSIYTRRFETLSDVAAQYHLTPCSTIAQAVRDADAVFVMVGYPSDVEAVFTGADGVFAHAKPGALAIDMTTSSPALAQRLHVLGKERGIRVLDAPVSGGDSGARNASLSIMVGGDEADFEAAAPFFAYMGKSIHYMGPAGAGQHTKAANQIAVAGATAAYTEALVYAEAVGLDPQASRPSAAGRPAPGRSPTWLPGCSGAISPPAFSSSTLSRTCASSRRSAAAGAWTWTCSTPSAPAMRRWRGRAWRTRELRP